MKRAFLGTSTYWVQLHVAVHLIDSPSLDHTRMVGAEKDGYAMGLVSFAAHVPPLSLARRF